MATVDLNGVTIAYDVFGEPEGEPVVLICGCGTPALGWQAGVVPALTAVGYRVVTFDNRALQSLRTASRRVKASRNPGLLTCLSDDDRE